MEHNLLDVSPAMEVKTIYYWRHAHSASNQVTENLGVRTAEQWSNVGKVVAATVWSGGYKDKATGQVDLSDRGRQQLYELAWPWRTFWAGDSQRSVDGKILDLPQRIVQSTMYRAQCTCQALFGGNAVGSGGSGLTEETNHTRTTL